MENSQDGHLRDYRQRLLDALRALPERRRREQSGTLRVFVNHEGVGRLDCAGGRAAFVYVSAKRPVELVELRTEAGLLVGSLCAPAWGKKTGEVHVGPYAIEVGITGGSQEGTVRLNARLIMSWPQRAWQAMAAGVARLGHREWPVRPKAEAWPSLSSAAVDHGWLRAVLVLQTCLILAVLFLLVDRLDDRVDQGTPVALVAPVVQEAEKPQARPATGEVSLDQHERMLASLAQGQGEILKTVRTQQRVEGRVRAEQKRIVVEIDRLRSQVAGLSLAKEALVKELAALQLRDRELELNMRRDMVELARALAPVETGKPVGGRLGEAASRPSTQPPQLAEIRPENPAHPLIFWVSFEEGTPETSIQQLIQEIHGRRGPTNAGWYNVEVNLPEPQTPDGFFESLKKTKIVKAVTTSLTPTPNR